MAETSQQSTKVGKELDHTLPAVLPQGQDWFIQRPKASTPGEVTLRSSRGSSVEFSDIGSDDSDELTRGRSREPTTLDDAPRQRAPATSQRQARRRRAVSVLPPGEEATSDDGAVGMGSPHSIASRESELDSQIMEPAYQEPVSTTVAERIEDDTASPGTSASSDSLLTSSDKSPTHERKSISVGSPAGRHPPSALLHSSLQPAHRLSDPAQTRWGYNSPSSIHRVSSPPVLGPGLSQTRDTFALLQQRSRSRTRIYPRGPSISRAGFEDLPFPAMLQLAALLDHRSYLAARLTCQSWCIALTHARPLGFPPAFRLPAEIVQAVYEHLDDPADFDAARHTCRSWMAASLEPRLLESMLQKGGWWASWSNEKVRQEQSQRHAHVNEEDDEIWTMSTALARESAMAAAPHASSPSNPKDLDASVGQLDGTDEDAGRSSSGNRSPFELVLETDFSELSDAYTWVFSVGICSKADPTTCYSLRFTPSICGRFVLAVDGYRIFVYRLGRSPIVSSNNWASNAFRTPPKPRTQAALHPVTSIVCPRRVLAVNMDTSARRHAVAVLMDDRMGLVCDLKAPGLDSSDSPQEPVEHTVPIDEELEGEHAYWSAYPSISPYAAAPRYFQTSPTSILFGGDSPADPNPGAVSSHWESMGNMSLYTSSRPCPSGVPIAREIGPRSVYRGLGAADDPPTTRRSAWRFVRSDAASPSAVRLA